MAVAACVAVVLASSAAAAGAPRRAPIESRAAFTLRAPLWASRYDGPAKGLDAASALAVGPSGKVIFVTGFSASARTGRDFTTVAYRAGTGARRWIRRYSGAGKRNDEATAIAISPDGRRVFVTGSTWQPDSLDDYATVAYDAATGAELWVRRFNPRSIEPEDATALAVSPDGKTVFVTGQSFGFASFDYVTVAYAAATGARRWVRRFNGPAGGDDAPSGIAVGPAGRAVYVTGRSYHRSGPRSDYATVAYSTATGRQRWARQHGVSGRAVNAATSVAVSPAGGRVYVTGASGATDGLNSDYDTVAYEASNGGQAWVRRYNGTGNGSDRATSLAVSPDGRWVFVTGSSSGLPAEGTGFGTVAYKAATGALAWVSRYNGPRNGSAYPFSLAVSPDGSTIYAAGLAYGGFRSSLDYAVVAYDAASGSQLWAGGYNGPRANRDSACCVEVGPGGDTIFITGASTRPGHGTDYATVGFNG
jgi:WD40 repeat protein